MSFQKTYQDDDYCHMIINWKKVQNELFATFQKKMPIFGVSLFFCWHWLKSGQTMIAKNTEKH